MELETYEKMQEDKIYHTAVIFIDRLLKAGIFISVIMTNDWHSNYKPSIYVAGRRYSRFSKFDAENAIKFMKGELAGS